jgi:histidinol-phosphate/aromatic aminotransferase/cobyric acid decarboxylase-like protein
MSILPSSQTSAASARVPAPRPLPSAYTREKPREQGALALDGNEGLRPDAALRALLAGAAAPADLETFAANFRDYPSSSALRADLAARFGLGIDRLAVTAGADGAIDRLFRAFLATGDEVLTVAPTFEMFPRFAALAGASLRSVPRRGDRFPVDEMVGAATPRTRIALVVSPNNPTGEVAAADDLRRLSGALPDCLVLLDHVYVEYADEDLTGVALELPNVVVLRTFSKARGLAGCRVGYALGPPSVLAALEVAGDPYPVAGPSLAAARASLGAGDATMARHAPTAPPCSRSSAASACRVRRRRRTSPCPASPAPATPSSTRCFAPASWSGDSTARDSKTRCASPFPKIPGPSPVS